MLLEVCQQSRLWAASRLLDVQMLGDHVRAKLAALGHNFAASHRPPRRKTTLERGVRICFSQPDSSDILTDGQVSARVSRADYEVS